MRRGFFLSIQPLLFGGYEHGSQVRGIRLHRPGLVGFVPKSCAIFPREVENPGKVGGVEPGPSRLRATVKRSARPPRSQRESVGREQGGLVPPTSRDERMSVKKMQTCHANFTFSHSEENKLKLQGVLT